MTSLTPRERAKRAIAKSKRAYGTLEDFIVAEISEAVQEWKGKYEKADSELAEVVSSMQTKRGIQEDDK